MNRISVIICTWNRSASLRATLLSLHEQSVPSETIVDVIVVDNNSTDDTRAEVDRLCSAWRRGTLRYVFEKRQGKQFALNTGIAACDSEILAFTDDDILFPGGWISSICNLFSDPRIDLAGGRTLLAWPEGGPPRWYAKEMAAILGGVDLGSQRLLPPPDGYAPAGANLVVRRTLFEQTGIFSESHFRHMDYEFGLRCREAGVCVVYEPALEVVAPVDPRMLSRRYFRRWSFKAGFSGPDEQEGDGRSFLSVPRWVYRQLAQDLVIFPVEYIFKPAGVAFTRELRICRAFGTISSRWYGRLWPDTYPQWVERYSQKKNNVY